MTARKNASTSLLRDAGRTAAATARRATRTPSRLAAGAAATAAVGAIAVTAATASSTSAASSLADDARPAPPVAAWPAATAAAKPATHSAQAATARSATTHPATATPDAAKKAPGAKTATAKAATAEKAASPTTIYDSVSPSAIPAGKAVAAYSNGSYQASSSSVAGRGHVLWIDTNGSSPKADALDVEPGDATPAGAATWVSQKLTKDHSATAIVYTFKSAWPSVTASISGLPSWMQGHVKYWIADPTGTPHVLPGAAATQWYWGPNYDITQAKPGFFS